MRERNRLHEGLAARVDGRVLDKGDVLLNFFILFFFGTFFMRDLWPEWKGGYSVKVMYLKSSVSLGSAGDAALCFATWLGFRV